MKGRDRERELNFMWLQRENIKKGERLKNKRKGIELNPAKKQYLAKIALVYS